MTILPIDNLLDLSHQISNYTICGEGNVSMRCSENTFLIKASGTNLHTLTKEDLTLCNVNGIQIDSSHKKPSIELSFHAWIMKIFPEINFIAHTHPPNTAKILCSNLIHNFAKERLFPDQVVRNGTKSCIVPYASPGEPILKLIKKNVSKFVKHEGIFPKLILLQNHGIITASRYKHDCVAATLMCEKAADIFIGANLLGGIKVLTKKEVADIDNCPNENYRRVIINESHLC